MAYPVTIFLFRYLVNFSRNFWEGCSAAAFMGELSLEGWCLTVTSCGERN